jgi:hypothetical protein
VALAASVILCLAGLAHATDFPESEGTTGNGPKSRANPVNGIISGDTISGSCSGTSVTDNNTAATSADTFLITTGALPRGHIYKHRLNFTTRNVTSGTTLHKGSIIGLLENGGVITTTDQPAQQSGTTASTISFNQWYGFGQEEQIYWRVTGASTTTNYVATLTTTDITSSVVDLGTVLPPGDITISRATGNTMSPDMWIYQYNDHGTPGDTSDDTIDAIVDAGAKSRTTLTRTLAAGTYFLALADYTSSTGTNGSMANNLPQPSDSGIRSNFPALDYPNGISHGNTSTNVGTNWNMKFQSSFVTASTTTVAKNGAFDIQWIRFTVGAPTSPVGGNTPPFSAIQGTQTTLAVKVIRATPAPDTITSVTLDGSSIGLPSNIACTDAGNDNWTAVVTIPAGAPLGTATFPVTVTDVQSRTSNSGNFTITVLAAPGPGFVAEIEPNDSKAQATMAAISDGGGIYGYSTGSSTTAPGDTSADYFLVSTPPASPAIYVHRLAVSSGVAATIRGVTTVGGSVVSGSDASLQGETYSFQSLNPNTLQWYGFGRQEQLYVRVTGTSTTTTPYSATLSSAQVTPVDIGVYAPGTISIGTFHQFNQGGVIVYDSNFNAIPDFKNVSTPDADAGTGNSLECLLTRSFNVGTYYLALSIGPKNNQGYVYDEGSGEMTQSAFDFPNALLEGSTTSSNQRTTFVVQDSQGRVRFSLARPDIAYNIASYGVLWCRMIVGPANPGACCMLDGSCSLLSVTACGSAAGTYSGNGVPCASVTCPGLGACCLPDLSCVRFSPSQCSAQGGTHQGVGVSCATRVCFAPGVLWNNGPVSTGATTLNGAAAPSGGTWSEDNSDASNSCAENGLVSALPLFGSSADDFTIADAGGWDISKFVVYTNAQDTGSLNPVTALLRIWNGRPGDPGSSLVLGAVGGRTVPQDPADFNAQPNRFLSRTATNIYPINNTLVPAPIAPNNTTQPLFKVEIDASITDINGNHPLHLGPGTYWMEFNVQADAPGGTLLYAPCVRHRQILATPGANSVTYVGIYNPTDPSAYATPLWPFDNRLAGSAPPETCSVNSMEIPFQVMGSAVVPGACCTGTSCAIVSGGAAACSGTYQGDNTACGPVGNPTTCCPANFDQINGLQVADIFAFLNAWFAGDLRTDFDHSGGLAVADIFAFLNAWFAGC